MKKLLGIAALVATIIAFAAGAQQVTPPGDTALVCAYNSSPPTIQSGKFGYLQCDSQGQLLINGNFIVATSNMIFQVATTGTVNNVCSVAQPCSTIQQAINVVASYNWVNKYYPTINVADGTYTGTVLLHALYNIVPGQTPILAGNNTTPTNVVIQSAVADAVNMDPYANWTLNGFQLKSTSGANADLNVTTYSTVNIDHIDFAGNYKLVQSTLFSFIYAPNATLSSSTTSARNAIYVQASAWFINDGATWTINNSPTFSDYFASVGDFGVLGTGTYINGNTVTGNRIFCYNFGWIEYAGTRASFPGNGIVQIQANSILNGDTNSVLGGYINTSASLDQTVALSDGISSKNLRADYNITNPINWTFSPVGGGIYLTAAAVGGTQFILTNTSAGGHQVYYGAQGSAATLGLAAGNSFILDVTTGLFNYWFDNTGIITLSNTLGFSAQTAFNANAPDSGVSRLGAASLALGNGTAGDFTGTLKLAHLTATALANSATTSAVCYNTGTGVLTYDGTIGTCTTSDERLKNMGERIPNALDKLLQINGVSYTWKEGYNLGTGPQIGVGAQTVERVFPELVQTGSDGYKSVDYQRLTAPIIEALRELKADNDNLKAELKSLKSRRRHH